MRKALITAGGAALALTLGACGNTTADGAYDDTASLVRAAAESTADASSAKISLDITMGPVSATGNGEGTFAGTDSMMAMTMSMDASAAGGGMVDMEMRMVDGTFYTKVPDDLPGVTTEPGKPWVEMSTEELGDALGMDMDKMLEQNDPTTSLELLEQHGELVSSENTDVDGTPAIKYTVDVDFTALIQQFGTGGAEMDQLERLDIDTVTMDAWIDDDDLPLQFRVDMGEVMEKSVESAGGSADGMDLDESAMTMRYHEWGTDVSVSAPPESQVGDGSLPGIGG